MRPRAADHPSERGPDPPRRRRRNSPPRRISPTGSWRQPAICASRWSEALPRALADLDEPRLGDQRRRRAAAGRDDRRRRERSTRRMDDRAANSSRGGTPRSASRAPASAAWRRPSGERGVSAAPGSDPRPQRTRRGGAGRAIPRDRRGRAGDAPRPPRSRSPRRAGIDAPGRARRPSARMRAASRRDRLVEGQEHEGVAARRRAGEVHGADVDVGLAEHDSRPGPSSRADPGGG